MSYSVWETDVNTSTPSDSNKRFIESSLLRGNGSLSYSYVTLVIFHCLISFGKTSIGWPRTIKRREFSLLRLLSRSCKHSKRNRHLFFDRLISSKESTSRKNTALKVELPSIACRRDGLSCNLSPFLNQWREFIFEVIAYDFRRAMKMKLRCFRFGNTSVTTAPTWHRQLPHKLDNARRKTENSDHHRDYCTSPKQRADKRDTIECWSNVCYDWPMAMFNRMLATIG